MPHSVPALVRLLAISVLASIGSTAEAGDTGMLPNGATLEWPRLKIRNEAGDLVELKDSDTLRHHLNLASCLCSQSQAGDTDLYFELHLTKETGVNPPGELWVGTQCEDDIARPMQCRKVGDVGDLDALAVREDNFAFRLFDLINASETQKTMACRQANRADAFAWVISDTDSNADPDFFSPRPLDLDLFMDVSGFDTQPPPLPEAITAAGSEGIVELKWTIPVGNGDDLYAFQAMCLGPDGNPVREPAAADKPLYSTTTTVCGVAQSFALTPTSIVSPDGVPVPAAPAGFTTLDPSLLCATETSGTATSIQIKGLSNNTQYTVGLIAIDFYGNPVATFMDKTVQPKPATDFWEDLHDRGSPVEGGFCAAGGSPTGWIPLLGVLAWIATRCVRRRAIASVIGALAVTAIAPSAASADEFSPYWEDPDADRAGDDSGPRWLVGIKLGPYTPEIDEQIGDKTGAFGPYRAMFGNYYTLDEDGNKIGHDTHVYQVLPMLEVDRILWSVSGQATLGVTLGYMQKSAYAYLDGTDPMDAFRPRTTAASNTFRLIPFAVTASYRVTQLDDLYGIPVVPYLRGGLSYYIWWLDGPDGNVSKVCRDGSMTPGCEANKAYGGSLGFQASFGVAVRAERIDAGAARSMVNSGIYHAGFYAEYMFAKVDGFGSAKKLSVGDKTWFAGINFEF